MHVRVRMFGQPDTIVVVESKLTKINRFREILKEKFDVEPKLQRLFYGGKLLENGYTFHDYNIRLNDVIQLMVYVEPKQQDKENDGIKTEGGTTDAMSANGIEFKDAQSKIYAIGDLIDMKDKEHGAWFEGKIKRIVTDPQATDTSNTETENIENVSPNKTTKDSHEGILYQINLDAEEEDSYYYCQGSEIRPRARTTIEVCDLVVGTTYMVNHNTFQPGEKGFWYDFKLDLMKKVNRNTELIGTLYLGPDSVPQNETKIRVHDKIFVIEQVVPLADRSVEYKKTIAVDPGRRSEPLNCLKCRDNEDVLCKDCGCYICSGKEFPDKIVLCDECEFGFHMICLDPPLTELPEGDWYCPGCKRDTKEVVAPGAAKQTKKVSTNSRDWGRGMACVGKTKSSLMPANHFGPIPGIEVGMCWRFRIQLSESGVHRPPVSGIHGRDVEGAYSIVLSGGYEDDVDNGIEFTYTGSGGRDLSGNKRTAEQSCDQKLTRENKALARNCAVPSISESGGDAGENWRNGKPVRVVRSYKMIKHFPKYAPKEGIRYDGIYKVVKYYPEKGLSGFIVWKYLLRRDDATPAPWEPNAKQYPIIYPDGFLEAEAEKKALKEKSKGKGKSTKKSKRAVKELDTSSSDASSPKKRKRNSISPQSPASPGVIKVKIPAIFTRLRRNNKNQNENNNPSSIEKEETDVASWTTKSSEDEAEIKAVKGKKKGKGKTARGSKRTLKESNTSSSDFDPSPAPKRTKSDDKDQSLIQSPDSVQVRIPKIFEKVHKNKKVDNVDNCLSTEEIEAIKADTLNSKLWSECLIVSRTRGKKEFVEYVTQMFLCIICQEVIVSPVTTSCLHNFCKGCLKLAIESSDTPSCPCCRKNLSGEPNEPNDKLKTALQAIMPGYDGGK